MENKKVVLNYKQIFVAISSIIALMGGELAIGTQVFKTENDRQFVGFFIDENTKKLKFLHFDNEIYRPKKNKKSDRYFIILDDGTKIFCY